MKKLICLVLCLTFVMSLSTFAFAESTNPSISVEKYITEAIYEDCNDFSEGYAAVKIDGKWGYIDENGKTVVEPKYYWAGNWHGGSAVVMEKMDYAGGTNYQNIFLYKEYLNNEVQGYGRIRMMTGIVGEDGSHGIGPVHFPVGEEDEWSLHYNAPNGVYIIDGQPCNTEVCDNEYECGEIITRETSAKLYNEGYTTVESSAFNSYWISSEDLIPMRAYQFNSADIPVKAFIMDHNGDIVKEFPTNSNAIVVIHDENEEYEIPKESYINEIKYCDSERMIARIGYTVYLVDENEQPCHVWWNGKTALFDLQGNLITIFKDKLGDDWNSYWSITNGMLRFKNGNDKFGALDKDGNLVIPVEYDYLSDFTENGFAYAEKDGEMFIIDKKNNRYNIPNPNGGFFTDPEDAIVYINSNSKNNVFAIYNTDVTYMITYSNGKFVVIDGSVGLGIVGYPENGIAGYYDEEKDKYGFVKLHFDGVEGYPETKEEPSAWAKDEVDAAIAEGLVPAELQKNYTSGISRGQLSKILSVLLDKVYGESPDKTDASFTDTADSDVLKAANLGIINGYKQSDGTFKFNPDNTLKRSEMAAIINRVAKLCGKTTTGYENEVKFTDTASHWCNSELGYPVHMGIVKGTSETTFSPENTLTVEQTIMMIYRTFKALK